MNGITNNLRIHEVNAEIKKAPNTNQTGAAASFKDVLNGVQFSKHADMRLNARQIKLSENQLSRVNNGIDKAGDKGIRDSLVLVDNIALVINVKSRTVITAMQQENENVFDHIDGAVIV
ncbi:MAG: hypothetical protein FWE82_07085 [Defluviitaleaceae bacterium]|nr:hypothetical protein [Defluviitaleaceae bacterium]